MKRIVVPSGYRQFYVTDLDRGQHKPGPYTGNDYVDFTDQDIANHYCDGDGILTLFTGTDMSAKVDLVPEDDFPPIRPFDFAAHTAIRISGNWIGIIGWPDDQVDVIRSVPMLYDVTFMGHNLSGVDREEDFYTLWIRPR